MRFGFLVPFALITLSAQAQSTALTYQGQLRNGAQPANGLHDMRFRLYDAAVAGNQIGAAVCANDVTVSDGKFTVPVDFGQQFGSTSPRFLEIDVRADFGSPCTDVFGYLTLSPRQLIVQAPRAQTANVANALVPPNGSLVNAMVVDNEGRVGVGTAAPGHSVTIAKPEPTLALQDTDSSGLSGGQQVGFISFSDNVNAERAWIGYRSQGDPDITIQNLRPGDIILNAFGGGRVGIGTASPLSTLDVRGSSVRLGSAGEFLAVTGEENLRIIRGTVGENTDCTVAPPSTGVGFTLTSLSCGEIRVNFTTPFATAPVVIASGPYGSCNCGDYRFVTCTGVSPFGVSIRVFNADGNNVRSSFHFIAIGRRP